VLRFVALVSAFGAYVVIANKNAHTGIPTYKHNRQKRRKKKVIKLYSQMTS
jgi:hypothetical protein